MTFACRAMDLEVRWVGLQNRAGTFLTWSQLVHHATSHYLSQTFTAFYATTVFTEQFCFLKDLRPKMSKFVRHLRLILDILSTLGLKANEQRTEVGGTTSQLGKRDHPSSAWMHHWPWPRSALSKCYFTFKISTSDRSKLVAHQKLGSRPT